MAVRAIANNDVAFIAWQVDQRIDGCLGFTVRRTEVGTSKAVALPAWVGFEAGSNTAWKPSDTDHWPIQRFAWLDVTAEHGRSYTYEVVPRVGTPDDLHDGPSLGHSEPVTLTADHGSVEMYVNRGILSTQSLAHQLQAGPGGGPSGVSLVEAISTPGNPIRNRLAGDMPAALTSLLRRAKQDGGDCYAALYELNDPDLVQALVDAGHAVHLILSNTGPDDATNADSRKRLHDAGIDVIDRMLGGGHIGHNKFMVYVDAQGTPQSVLSGSTNWSITGMCAQSNNCIIVHSTDLAAAYVEYWKALQADGAAQAAPLRTGDRTVRQATVDGAAVDLWFSPNTRLHTKPAHDAARPVDLDEVYAAIAQARQGILFLLFQPGSPSVLDPISAAHNANDELFVRGAVTDPHAVDQFTVQLLHRRGTPPDVVAATAVDDAFSNWEKELLKVPGGHAIIHDKVIVIDPFDDGCVVVTGSHNLGYTASYKNDENLLIVRGDKALAAAYATHVVDLYDHYRWRYRLQQERTHAWSSLDRTDAWQDVNFSDPTRRQERAFWQAQAAVPAH